MGINCCDICQIGYACTVTKKDGELKNNNGPTFLKLAACQYSGPEEYQEAYEELVKDEKIQKWLSIHNDPEYKRPRGKYARKVREGQCLLVVVP